MEYTAVAFLPSTIHVYQLMELCKITCTCTCTLYMCIRSVDEPKTLFFWTGSICYINESLKSNDQNGLNTLVKMYSALPNYDLTLDKHTVVMQRLLMYIHVYVHVYTCHYKLSTSVKHVLWTHTRKSYCCSSTVHLPVHV